MSDNNNEKKSENIFEIMDGMMFQLNKTKKMFVIMILTVLILPPIGLLVTVNVFDPPIERGELQRERFMRDLERMMGEDFSDEELERIQERIRAQNDDRPRGPPVFKGPQLVIFVISIIWLGIGIRQWFVLSKFSKRYELFKKRQAEIDKKLDEENNKGET